jgi:polysaccharide biosynthesis protein PslL
LNRKAHTGARAACVRFAVKLFRLVRVGMGLMKERVAHIDIAKGIGILLVIFGHNWIVLNNKGEIYNIVYSFHVPLFFFLSGIFLNPNKPFMAMLKEKANTLLKPYFVTVIIVEILFIAFKAANDTFGEYIFGIFYATGPHIRWVWMWFLPHLFLISVFSWFFLNLTRLEKSNFPIQFLALFCLLAIGRLTIRSFWAMPYTWKGHYWKINGLPFSADIGLISSFYFMLGYFIRGWIKNPRFNLLWLAFIAALFFGLHALTEFRTDLNLRRYDSLIFSTALALAGIFMVIEISRLLANFDWLARGFTYLGANSLVILIFHAPLQDYSFDLLAKFSERYFYVAVATFLIAVIGSVVIVELAKRVGFLLSNYSQANKNTGGNDLLPQ